MLKHATSEATPRMVMEIHVGVTSEGHVVMQTNCTDKIGFYGLLEMGKQIFEKQQKDKEARPGLCLPPVGMNGDNLRG